MEPLFQPHFEWLRRTGDEMRPKERLLKHYLLEKKFAGELKFSPKELRSSLYREVYERLFAELPDHPQHTAKLTESRHVETQVSLLRKLVPKDAVFVEVGAGDGRLSVAMAPHCARVLAVDVTPDVLVEERPENFSFVRTNGTLFDIPEGSVDFVYSNQLMEHLHPDDAREQLSDIVRILKRGGVYFCITPNVHSGPHDISKFFDLEATGLHLREYSYVSLAAEFRAAGFTSITPLLQRRGQAVKFPFLAAKLLEACLATALRRHSALRCNPKIRALLGIAMLGNK